MNTYSLTGRHRSDKVPLSMPLVLGAGTLADAVRSAWQMGIQTDSAKVKDDRTGRWTSVPARDLDAAKASLSKRVG